MSNVIQPPRQRGSSQEIRSQVALELLLNVYAVIGTGILLRCLFLGLGVRDRLWLGRIVYDWTDLLVTPLNLLPGAEYELYRALTVADVTMLSGVILFPLGLLAQGSRRQRNR